MRKVKIALLSVIILATLVSCANFSNNTYKTIYIAGQSYDLAMRTVSELQKQGKITAAQREEINKYGTAYYMAYNASIDSLELYMRVEDQTTKDKVISILQELMGKWTAFAVYVNSLIPNTISPKLPKKIEDVPTSTSVIPK